MALLLLGWCVTRLLGCSSGSSDTGGGPYGGQTGSLTPSCGVAPLTNDGAAVASGSDVAIVYTAGCPDPNSLTVTGPGGTPVGYSLVQLDDGVYIVHTDVALSPGSYLVSLASGSTGATQVTVSDTAPAPTKLGTITPNGIGGCSEATFTLTLDPSAVPYATLLGLEAQIDNGPTFTWVPYGALTLDGGQSVLEIRCAEACDLDGVHTLDVHPTVAGQGALPSISVAFSATCGSAETPPSSCSTSLPRSTCSWPALLAAALVVAVQFRRRRDSG
jgi:hypothetical protein